MKPAAQDRQDSMGDLYNSIGMLIDNSELTLPEIMAVLATMQNTLYKLFEETVCKE